MSVLLPHQMLRQTVYMIYNFKLKLKIALVLLISPNFFVLPRVPLSNVAWGTQSLLINAISFLIVLVNSVVGSLKCSLIPRMTADFLVACHYFV
jgi:hypothetical protein